MRQTTRLLATIVKGERTHLNANTPTGLTGVFTHPTPRPHLLYLYNHTLSKLQSLPAESVYRQSTEALTKHRLAIVQAAVPAGQQEWQKRLETIANGDEATPERSLSRLMLQGKGYLPQKPDERDERYVEWDDDTGQERTEGPRMGDDLKTDQGKEFGDKMETHEIRPQHVFVEDEPGLSVDQ